MRGDICQRAGAKRKGKRDKSLGSSPVMLQFRQCEPPLLRPPEFEALESDPLIPLGWLRETSLAVLQQRRRVTALVI